MKCATRAVVMCAVVSWTALLVGSLSTCQTRSFAQDAGYLSPCMEPVEPPILVLAAGCDDNDCNPRMGGCTPTEEVVLDYCCVDLDGNGIYNCAVCRRRMYICLCPGGLEVPRIGPYERCIANPPYQRCTP